MRTYYYVVATPEIGSWEIRSSLRASPLVFPTRDSALGSARQMCRRRWEEHGTPCGVRILGNTGDWVDEFVCGDVLDEPDQGAPGQ